MKKKLVVMTLLTLCVAAGIAGCSKEKPMDETPVQTETRTETETESANLTEETTIEALEPPTKIPPGTAPDKTAGWNSHLIVAIDIHRLARRLADGKEAFTYMIEHGDGEMVNYTRQIIDAFLDKVIEEKPQALILSGGLSLNGEKLSHEELASKLVKMEDAEIPVVVIPGNHDISNPAAAQFQEEDHFPAEQTTPEGFETTYYDFDYGEALSRDEHSLSYTYQLNDFNRLLMLDGCQYDDGYRVNGMMKLEAYGQIEEQADIVWSEGMNIIPVSHHNLMDGNQVYVDDCTIEHSEELQQKLCNWRIPWFLSGHLYVQHSKNNESYGVNEIVTSSLSTAPYQYGVLDYGDDGSSEYYTKTVDMAAWASRTGDKNRHLLDFPEYSKKILERVFYNKVMDTCKNSNIPCHDKAQMINLYAKLDIYSYAGKAMEIVSKVAEDLTYQLQEKYDGSDILYQYMQEIVRDTVVDYNHFKEK